MFTTCIPNVHNAVHKSNVLKQKNIYKLEYLKNSFKKSWIFGVVIAKFKSQMVKTVKN